MLTQGLLLLAYMIDEWRLTSTFILLMLLLLLLLLAGRSSALRAQPAYIATYSRGLCRSLLN